MSNLPKTIRVLFWTPLAVFFAFAPLAISQILQMLTIPVRPLSLPLFRKLNTAIAGGIWGYWAWAIQRVNGTTITYEGDAVPERENAIVIANHRQMGDIVVLLCLAQKAKYVDHMKWFVKDALKYVPGIGWGMVFLDCVFLKRTWAKDAARTQRLFHKIAQEKLPVWMVSFPEGTRSTEFKRAAGREQDIGRGMEPYQHLLRPRYKGFASSVLGLSGHVKAVYSVTIGYHGHDPKLINLVRGDTRQINLHVRRTPLEDLPRTENGLASWLTDEFHKKDALLEKFAATGKFTPPDDQSP